MLSSEKVNMLLVKARNQAQAAMKLLYSKESAQERVSAGQRDEFKPIRIGELKLKEAIPMRQPLLRLDNVSLIC